MKNIENHNDHIRENNSGGLPEIIRLDRARDIDTYKPSAALQAVVKMAVALGRPLLLAGKPGVGKTQFAHWFASRHKDFNQTVFQFNTKSTSIFTDLFYEYDAVWKI